MPAVVSVWDALLDAAVAVVQDAVDAAGRADPSFAPLGLDRVPVRRRKWPAAVFPQDPRPIVLVGQAADERLEPYTGEADAAYYGHYPVLVAVYGPPAKPGVTDTPPEARWLLAVRPAARKALLDWHAYPPIAFPAGVALDDCDDAAGGSAGNQTPYFPVNPLDSAAVTVTYRTREARR